MTITIHPHGQTPISHQVSTSDSDLPPACFLADFLHDRMADLRIDRPELIRRAKGKLSLSTLNNLLADRGNPRLTTLIDLLTLLEIDIALHFDSADKNSPACLRM
jgi:DNA-binding phage protein